MDNPGVEGALERAQGIRRGREPGDRGHQGAGRAAAEDPYPVDGLVRRDADGQGVIESAFNSGWARMGLARTSNKSDKIRKPTDGK